MERKISFNDVQKAVDEAYEAVKSIKEGAIDPRNVDADEKAFGIAVVLTDGTVIKKADVDVKAPMGRISRVPLSSILFTQNTVEELMKKAGKTHCCALKQMEKPAGLDVCPHSIRAFSAMEPVGDPNSKWDLYEGRMIDLMGSAPILDDKVYKAIKQQITDANFEDMLAKAGYYLYDDAALSIDLFAKAQAMTASAEQLAMMGATIAADGVNPVTKKIVFDGEISKNIVAMMAAKGPHKMTMPWLVGTGLPARNSFGGLMFGVMPGVFGIAAYAPALNEAGIPVKAALGIKHFMNALDLSVFSSAKVTIVK